MSDLAKMTFKVFAPMWEKFDAELQSLPVNRNKFLSCVIKKELPRLRDAIGGRCLSGKANRWVSTQLHSMKPGLKAVSIDIDPDVARDLRIIVNQSRLVRDAFFNRLVAFLRASDPWLKYLDLPTREDRTVGRSYVNIEKPVSPIRALAETFDDPLWYIHMAIAEIYETNMYLLELPLHKFGGFSCWIDDSEVPNTKANKRKLKELDWLSNSLAEFEKDAFAPTKTGAAS